MKFLFLLLLSLNCFAENGSMVTSGNAGASFNSTELPMYNSLGISTTTVLSGSAIGVINLQASNDFSSPTNWVDLETAVALTNAAPVKIDEKDAYYKWIRLKYTRTSGTGTIDTRFTKKQDR
jgi:hypothetical protein